MNCAKAQEMPLMQSKKPNPTPPTGLGSTTLNSEHSNHQDSNSVECYSDLNGYPTLPRPKVIVSLRHSHTGTWDRKQASLLQTVPVRIGPPLNSSEEPKRGRSLSLDAATKLRTGNLLQQPPIKNKEDPEKGKSTRSKTKIGRSQSLYTPRTSKLSNGSQPVCDSPLLTSSREPSQTPPAQLSPTFIDMSTNHSRVQARKAAADSNKASSKKPRKIGRAITFAFGAGSDKKRRSLGFFGKSKEVTEDNEYDILSSPILKTRKSTKVSASSSVNNFQWKTAQDEFDWDPAAVYPRQEGGGLIRNHFGSCRDFHSIDEGEELRHQPRVPIFIPMSSDITSPENSPTFSGLTSRQDSYESLSLSLQSEPVLLRSISTPPSRSNSPVVWKFGETHTLGQPRQRKLSDPALIAPSMIPQDRESPSLSQGSSPRSSTLKKRNTFCVKENKLTPKPGWHEMRHHVVRFLLETEQSYVQSLRNVIKVYMEPLHRPQATALIEPHLAKDIFHQIPEIYQLHEKFIGQVAARVEGWTPESKIGDVFVNTFSKCHLMDVYRKFIGNFMRAKSAIEIAKQARPVFAKFLEQRAKDSKGRFTLDDLLIKPVQRIPRYVLFIKDLLKHTTVGHPDHAPLQHALGELTALAEKVNASERERGRLEELRELLAAVDGLAQLVKPQSRFIRYDMVTEIKGNVQKKDRFLILFSDMVVCACARRKSTGFIRGSLLNLNSPFADALKHTVKWHIPLTSVSRAQLQGPTFDKRKQNTLEKILENLIKDEKTLQQMVELSNTLHTPHQALATTLKNLQADIREKLSDKRTELENLPMESGRIDLISYTSASPTHYAVVFPSQRIRNSWELDFIKVKSDADQQAPPNTQVAPPMSPIPQSSDDLSSEFTFVQPVALQSGRVGTELTCGSLGLPVDTESPYCLWMCSGSSAVGQVSIVDLLPSTPPHTLTNITVSDSPITCITVIPQIPPANMSSLPPTISIDSFSSISSLSSIDDEVSNLDNEASKSVSNLEDSLTVAVNGETDSLSGQLLQPNDQLLIDAQQIRSTSAPPFPDQALSQEQTFSPPATPKLVSPLTLRALNFDWVEGTSEHCMWLGTEKGQLFMYSPGHNLRSRNLRQCVQLEAPISCVRYHENLVYVGLSNGVLAIFDPASPGSGPVSCVRVSEVPVVTCVPLMIGVGLCSGGTLFLLGADRQSVSPLATLPSGQVIREAVEVVGGVWVSVQDSPTLHLLHIPSGQILVSIDCTVPVVNILQGYNPIIRQHKSASLQVTALLATPTHLVAGTSAGVAVTFPLPILEHSLEPHPLSQLPTPVALLKGHVGPIRFLTSLIKEKSTLVVTGGNGYEDLVAMATSREVPETSNCLLLWSFQS